MKSQAELAERIARRIHANQKDKAGVDYVSHLASVAACFDDDTLQAIAWLHDALEDTSETPSSLASLEVDDAIIESVLYLTHRLDESYDEYLIRVAQNSHAKRVKQADLNHNIDLSRIDHPTEKDYARVEKYKRALAFLES